LHLKRKLVIASQNSRSRIAAPACKTGSWLFNT